VASRTPTTGLPWGLRVALDLPPQGLDDRVSFFEHWMDHVLGAFFI
jgi:hypothetical protein